jgi:hypothetical protein
MWTDDPAASLKLKAMLTAAKRRVSGTFGEVMPARLIHCTTQDCAERLGLSAPGMSYGAQMVILGPEADEAVLGHELCHIGLHRGHGLRALVAPPFPAWFDEGLAVLLSPDERYTRPEALGDAEWIRAALTPRQWGEMVTSENWAQAHGSAGRLVEEVEAEIGREGVRALIEEVSDGGVFDDVLAALRADGPSNG